MMFRGFVGSFVPTKYQMYHQNSEKSFLGEGADAP